jgi:hypothetical protein
MLSQILASKNPAVTPVSSGNVGGSGSTFNTSFYDPAMQQF